MDINVHNFREEYEDINIKLKNSCFIGFDAEFTAILSGDAFKHRLFDTTESRYNAIRAQIHKMIMSQVGLTIFEYDRHMETYQASVYTFHLRPQVFGDVDQSFMFQASTLKFLCKHKFDFNKFIYDGIPFLSKAEEAHVREQIKDGTLIGNLMGALELSEERMLQKNCTDVLNDGCASAAASVLCVQGSRRLTDVRWYQAGEEGTMYLDADSPVMRYLLHREVRERHPAALTTDSLGNGRKILIYRDKSVDGATSLSLETLGENLLTELLGFSNIIQLLEKYRKPIVGHNLFLDVLLLHSQFIGPMPRSYGEFKRNVNRVFPEVFDTKHISHRMAKLLTFDEVWKSNAQQDLYEYFESGRCPALRGRRADVRLTAAFAPAQTYHEAGWDSYCAGYCFIRLGQWAARAHGSARRPAPAQLLHALRPRANRVNVIRAAVPYMNLVGADPPRYVPDLLHVKAVKDRVININKVAALLASCGSVDVRPLGARAALVAAGSRLTADRILKQFANGAEYRVSRYSRLRHSAAGQLGLWSGGAVLTGALIYFIHKKINS